MKISPMFPPIIRIRLIVNTRTISVHNFCLNLFGNWNFSCQCRGEHLGDSSFQIFLSFSPLSFKGGAYPYFILLYVEEHVSVIKRFLRI